MIKLLDPIIFPTTPKLPLILALPIIFALFAIKLPVIRRFPVKLIFEVLMLELP